MTTKRKTRATTRRKKSSVTVAQMPSDEMRQAWLLIQSLTCALIAKLQSVLATHDVADEGWERLFGAKDSTVINLQKLVAVLGEISDRLAHHASEAGQVSASVAPMDTHDMTMLKRWLEQELQQMQPVD